jgi:EAL domain-containing protein (putative c-di-GMP-specific phosphodiesterase class I)
MSVMWWRVGRRQRAVKHHGDLVDFLISMPVHRFVKEGAAGLREQPGGDLLPPFGVPPEPPPDTSNEAVETPAGEEWNPAARRTAAGSGEQIQAIRVEPIDTSLAVPVKTLQGIAVAFPNLELEERAPRPDPAQAPAAPPAAVDVVPESPPVLELSPAALETAMETLPPALEVPLPVDEAVPPPPMEMLPAPIDVPALEPPAAAAELPADAESWRGAAEEWGDHKRGAPATISALAWAPPTAVFQRAVDEMWIAWQPIVDWTSRTLHGYEALLRTADPLLARPRLLVEAAGRIGRLPELGRKARKLTAETAGDAPDGARLFVNLHPRELLDDRLCAGDDELGPHAHKCVLEITERVALDDIPEARARIQQLRLVGYNIAVGSIGSGYAGLASVAELEPDVVKLDKALIRNLHNEPVRRRLVGAMLAACKDLGLSAVAEGVQNGEERDALADLGCDLMQGFLFGPPDRGFPEPRW